MIYMFKPINNIMGDISPFEILGIDETSDKRIVSSAYRRMLLLIHPDKIRENKLGWTERQRLEAFEKIREAYKTIVRDYNFEDMPTEDPQYNEESIDKMDNRDFKNCRSVKEFNILYEKKKQNDEKSGFNDPFTHGYKDFNRPTDDKETEMLLTKKYKIKKKKNAGKPHKIVKFNPSGVVNDTSFHEFGLTNIDDYSFADNNTKNGLGGSDLSHVHSDYKNWDDSVDLRVHNKYNKLTDLGTKLEDVMTERSNFLTNIDKEYKKAKKNKK